MGGAKDKMPDVSELLKSIEAEGIIVLNNKGEIVEHIGMSNKDNLSAMLVVINEMITDFSKEINIGALELIVIRAEEGFFIFCKIEDLIVGLRSKEVQKLGLIVASVKKLMKVKQNSK